MSVLSISIIVMSAAVLLLPLIPLRVNAAYADGVFTLSGQAGPLPVKLFPRQKIRKKWAEKDAEKDARKLTERVPPPVLRILAGCLWQTAGRFWRKVRICALLVRYTAGGPDPAEAVMAYARAGIVLEAVAAAVDCADLRADVDFDAGRACFEGSVGISARLGSVLAAAFCFGIAFLRRYYRYKREKE